jgi:hypothetical protein
MAARNKKGILPSKFEIVPLRRNGSKLIVSDLGGFYKPLPHGGEKGRGTGRRRQGMEPEELIRLVEGLKSLGYRIDAYKDGAQGFELVIHRLPQETTKREQV